MTEFSHHDLPPPYHIEAEVGKGFHVEPNACLVVYLM